MGHMKRLRRAFLIVLIFRPPSDGAKLDSSFRQASPTGGLVEFVVLIVRNVLTINGRRNILTKIPKYLP